MSTQATIATSINSQNKIIYSIEDFISRKPLTGITDYDSMSFSISEENIIIPLQNVVTTTYGKELKNLAMDVMLTQEEYKKYRFKPKLMSYDIYGNQELFYTILFVNGLWNIKDFSLKRKKLKLVPKSQLFEYMSNVHEAEINNITAFNNQYVK